MNKNKRLWRIGLSALAIWLCVSAMGCSAPGKQAVMSHVEQLHGKIPELIAVEKVSREEVYYTFKFPDEDLLFRVESLLIDGNYGKNSWIRSCYNNCLLEQEEEVIRDLAASHSLTFVLEEERPLSARNLYIYMDDASKQAEAAVDFILELNEKYSFDSDNLNRILFFETDKTDYIAETTFRQLNIIFNERDEEAAQRYFVNIDDPITESLYKRCQSFLTI